MEVDVVGRCLLWGAGFCREVAVVVRLLLYGVAVVGR